MESWSLPLEPLFTPAEAAEYLKVSRRTLYRFLKQGRLSAVKLNGGGLRIRQSDLEAALTPAEPKQVAG
jgi:excisionase family DNA binding protein